MAIITIKRKYPRYKFNYNIFNIKPINIKNKKKSR